MVQVGPGVAVAVALGEGLTGAGKKAIGVALAVDVGGRVQVGVGSAGAAVKVNEAVGANGVAVIVGARDGARLQAVIVPTNPTRPMANPGRSSFPLQILSTIPLNS